MNKKTLEIETEPRVSI